jgi:hypothetical protein
MSLMTEEEERQMKIETMRVKIPDIITNLRALQRTDSQQTVPEKMAVVASLAILEDLGTEYTDEELEEAWNNTQTVLSTLEKWGRYW